MTAEITIRKAILVDAKKLSILYKTIYIQTYGIEGVSDEFANFITKQFAVSRIENTIQTLPDNIFVAEYKGNLIGVVEIEFDKICPVNKIIIPELNKIYVLERFFGKGVGLKLLQVAEQEVSAKGFDKIWLRVLISNDRAISFYERNHYSCIGNDPFQMETNCYDNKVMLKELVF